MLHIHDAISDAKVNRLERVSLFAGCTTRELQAAGRLGDVLRLPAGALVMRQGAYGHEVVVVLDGLVGVSCDGTQVATLGAGAVVGEVAVLCRGRRNATVVTLTPIELLVFDARSFTSLLHEAPGVTSRILAQTAQRSVAQAAAVAPVQTS